MRVIVEYSFNYILMMNRGHKRLRFLSFFIDYFFKKMFLPVLQVFKKKLDMFINQIICSEQSDKIFYFCMK